MSSTTLQRVPTSANTATSTPSTATSQLSSFSPDFTWRPDSSSNTSFASSSRNDEHSGLPNLASSGRRTSLCSPYRDDPIHLPPLIPSSHVPTLRSEFAHESANEGLSGLGLQRPSSGSGPLLSWDREHHAESSTRHILAGSHLRRSPIKRKRILAHHSPLSLSHSLPASLGPSLPAYADRNRTTDGNHAPLLYADMPARHSSDESRAYRGSMTANTSPTRASATLGAPQSTSNPLHDGQHPTMEHQSIPPRYPSAYGDGNPTSRLGNSSPFEASTPDPPLSGDQYTYALNLYSHILDAIPSVRCSGDQFPAGQPFDSVLKLASDGARLFSGEPTHAVSVQQSGSTSASGSLYTSTGAGSTLHESTVPSRGHPEPLYPASNHLLGNQSASTVERRYSDQVPTESSLPPAKRQAVSTHSGERKTTQCLGCGATETPEWRRGPMGPRTLCNACGLVHMKLQRKKKKQEEKAALAAKEKAGLT